MKIILRDIGIDLIPETPEEIAALERFWNGGIFLLGYGTSGRLTLSFTDLIKKSDMSAGSVIGEGLEEALHELHYIRTNNKSSENLIKTIRKLDDAIDIMKHLKVAKGDIILCKCGHWIDFVGTKWQHLEEVLRENEAYTGPVRPWSVKDKKLIKYRETCYHCDCIEPAPKNTEEKS